jgi:hypothetical protein
MKITNDIIIKINELYLELGVKTKVAKAIGCSPSTVTKYLIKDFVPIKDIDAKETKTIVLPPKTTIDWDNISCELTEQEILDLEGIKKKIVL